MNHEVLILRGTGKPDENHRIEKQLVRLEGFEMSVSVNKVDVTFPYRLGNTCYLKVYDPKRQKDCDNDTRAWRASFIVTDTQISGSALYVVGYSGFGEFDTITVRECDDDHLPWEHDGVCETEQEHRYIGPVELSLYQWGDPKPLSHEFDISLGGAIDKIEKVKAELAE